jgi:RNA polymerase subunit RPABC4/transcription elongation factor Spt4
MPLEDMTKDQRKPLIKSFLKEMYFERRDTIFKWARLTKQTPLIETKFLGQNLVSLITGISGSGSAARGDDLVDGSEIKTCSRLDQLSKCTNCGAYITAIDEVCPSCGGPVTVRMTDSHWIFTINTDAKRDKILDHTPAIYLLLIDGYELNDTELARFTVWKINPATDRYFRQDYVNDYYNSNFTRRRRAGENPAPMNMHPRSPKFSRTNARIVFEAVMKKTGNTDILTF